MNKLDVALKLLQLLNERKTIDSRIVSHELNVSLRTAQRYLVELSILPCVISSGNHTYSLNPDYELSGSLRLSKPEKPFGDPAVAQPFRKYTLAKTVCILCGSERGEIQKISTLAGHHKASNVSKIDRLTALISKRMKSGNKCSFP